MSTRGRIIALAAGAVGVLGFASGPASAQTGPPTGFSESTVLDGLVNPTALRFLPSDQGILVAEKRGTVQRFDSLGDTSPQTILDLRTDVYNFWDRGLIGIALDPNFGPTSNRYLYVLYARDALIGGASPRWGQPGANDDGCPEANPPTVAEPGPTAGGCVISGRLARYTINSSASATNSPVTLVDDWCQQYPSHSVGDLAFDSTGALYAGAGDGASFEFADYGQGGVPGHENPCGDPSQEGGSLRSQDVRTSSDSTGLDGSIIRIDRATGAAASGNPASGDANAKRVVAYGFRNPYRMAFRPGTNELWIGDVGWGATEEIDRLPHAPASRVNFGWPCYEGMAPQDGFQYSGLALCDDLYNGFVPAPAQPFYEYAHDDLVAPGDACPSGTSAITGLAFEQSGDFPARYDDALFFADYSRNCIWAMLDTNGDSIPDPSAIETFRPGAMAPVDLRFGPDGALYYAYIGSGGADGAIKRIAYAAPTAVATASPTDGQSPLAVQFNGGASTDPDDVQSALDFDWDFDGNGTYDSSAMSPLHTYTQSGSFTARLRVTDPAGSVSFDTVEIDVDNSPPVPTINSPAPGTLWSVGDRIDYSGSATDVEDGTLAPSRLSWSIVIYHCPGGCHEHPLVSSLAGAGGSMAAPDHEWPSNLALRLTATDSFGRKTTVERMIYPRTVDYVLDTDPAGLRVTFDATTALAPIERTVIDGSTHSVATSTPQGDLTWQSWSDSGAMLHQVVATPTSNTLTASFAAPPAPDPPQSDPPPDEPEPPSQPVRRCRGLTASIVGSNEGDVLRGTSEDDVIMARGGSDDVRGRGGDDTICGNGGADDMRGGPGDDRLDGGTGRDVCVGAKTDKVRDCP